MANKLNDDVKPERSLHSRISTGVTFVNKSKHAVQVLWLSYQGEPVWYNDLSPGSSYWQQTYVTHPWVCMECDTGRFELMELNSQEVLYPEEKDIKGVITEPKRTLYELCLATVRNSLHQTLGVSLFDRLKPKDVHRLPLPSRVADTVLSVDSAPPSPLVANYVAALREKLK